MDGDAPGTGAGGNGDGRAFGGSGDGRVSGGNGDGRGHGTRDRRLIGLAWALAALGVVSSAVSWPLHVWLAHRAPLERLYLSDLLLGMIWPVAGALVAARQPRNRVAWVLLATSLLGPYQLLAHYAAASELITDRPLPGAGFAAWVSAWGFVPYFFCVPLLPLLFPDGRAPSRAWRIVARVVAATAGVCTLAAMTHPGSDISDAVDNPLAVEIGMPWIGLALRVGAYVTLLGGTLAGAACLVLRARRAVGLERAQLQWLMLGGVALAGGMVVALLFDVSTRGGELASDLAMSTGIVALPAAVVVAMLRHRLFDVETVLARTVAYGLLIGLLLTAYALVVAGVGALAMGSPVGFAAVGAAAVAVAAGHGVVQGAVERLLFGHRRNPYAVVFRVGRQVAPAAQPVEALQRLVDAVRRTLRLPYAAFTGPAGFVAAGEPAAGWDTVPCLVLGQRVGELHVGRRPTGEGWLRQEREALQEVAARAATLAYAAGLVQDVAGSRARIVTAREEERRRLRADLHDGLGPALAGTAHQLDALARRIAAAGGIQGQVRDADRGGPRAEDLAAWEEDVRGLRDRLRASVRELRAVVQGLRPAVLDQLTLPGALRELVSGYETPVCHCRIDPACAVLPAAVEVAAYRIAAEAVSNALRHSAAGELRLDAEVRAGVLLLTVRDNGCGIPPRHRAGVGLRSMAERAHEVGGSLLLRPAPGGGTVVRATLPTTPGADAPQSEHLEHLGVSTRREGLVAETVSGDDERTE